MTAKESLTKLMKFDAEKEIEKKTCLIFFSAVICAAALLEILFSSGGEVVRDYFYYGDALVNGVVPYEPYNDLNWEYPPLTHLFMLIPRLFGSDPYSYRAAYIVMIALFLLAGLCIIRKMALKHSQNVKVPMLVYVLTMVLISQFIFDRFDIIAGIITLAAIFLYLEKKYPWAFILVAVGMFVKLYPGILFFTFLIPLLVSRDREWIKGAAVFCISSVLMLAPFILWSPDTFLTFVSYHTERGIQIESTASSFILFLEILSFTSTQTASVSWAADIQGGAVNAVLPIMMPLLIAAIVLFYAAYYVHCRKECGREESLQSVAMASFAAILIFIVFNKVFSAQYVIWLLTAAIPFMILIKKPEQQTVVVLAFLSIIVLTFYFGMFYKAVCYHDPFGVVILLMRNIMVAALMVAVLHYSGMFKGPAGHVKQSIGRIVKRSESEKGKFA